MNALIAWPIFAGIALLAIAIEFPKTRIWVALAVAGYFVWSSFAGKLMWLRSTDTSTIPNQ